MRIAAMVVGAGGLSEHVSLLAGRSRLRVQSKASRVFVPMVISAFVVILCAFVYSGSLVTPTEQLGDISNVGDQVLKEIAHVASKSGKLRAEAISLQTQDAKIHRALSLSRVDASADEHAIRKFSTDITLAKPLVASEEALVTQLQASIKAAGEGIVVAQKAMDAATAVEAADKEKYLKAAAPWQKIQSQEALAQKKYRADEQHLKKLVNQASTHPSNVDAQDDLAALEKKLHNDRKVARSGSVGIDQLGVLADQQMLVDNLNNAQQEASSATNKYNDLLEKKNGLNDRLLAEKRQLAKDKARIVADQRMLAHFKDLLNTVHAEEKIETGQKLKVMSRVKELMASTTIANGDVVSAAKK
jgi:hypothetical protein